MPVAIVRRGAVVRARSIIHGLECPLRRIATAEGEAVSSALEMQRYEVRRQWLVVVVHFRGSAPAIVPAPTNIDISTKDATQELASTAFGRRPAYDAGTLCTQ